MSNTFFISFTEQKDTFRDKSTAAYKFRAPLADTECLDDLNILAKKIDDNFAQFTTSASINNGLLSTSTTAGAAATTAIVTNNNNSAATTTKNRTFNGIKYNNLGKSGLRVSNIGFDTSSIFNADVTSEQAEKVLSEVYNHGINLFEVNDSRSEAEFGKLAKKLQWRRMTFVVVKKLSWSPKSEERGLSRKFIIEAIRNSLVQMDLTFIDLVLVQKNDSLCPMEEIVRAFSFLIGHGHVMYWGTSKWSAVEIMDAYNHSRQFNCIAPIVEFTEYHSFCREKVEIYMPELMYKIGIGLMVWSNFSSGFQIQLNDFYENCLKINVLKNFKNYACSDNEFTNFINDESKAFSTKFHRLDAISKQLNCTLQQLLVAWILRSELVQCLMIGSDCLNQFYTLVDSFAVVGHLNDNVMNEIELILDNKPRPPPRISTLALR